MLAILGITAPIFILVGIGFLACRSELISREQAAGMGASSSPSRCRRW